jgi:crotonobetainyl-CoA:carnitine CoA-transferase CaiB-like acyl-CoA transferase
VRTPAPLLGEQTTSLLRELGIDDARLEELRADSVIG